MSKTASEDLFKLVKALDKSEKRYFSVAALASSQGNRGFLKLFKAIDKQNTYDEAALLRSETYISHFPSKKIQLYDQLLKSLGGFHGGSDRYATLLQNLQKAKILFNKGLNEQSDKLINKSLRLAEDSEYYHIMIQFLFLKLELIRGSFFGLHERDDLTTIYQKLSFCIEQIQQNVRASQLLFDIDYLTFKEGRSAATSDIGRFDSRLLSVKEASKQPEISVFARYCYMQFIVAYMYLNKRISQAYGTLKSMLNLFAEYEWFRTENEALYFYTINSYIFCLVETNNLKELEAQYDYFVSIPFKVARIKKNLFVQLTSARMHLFITLGEFENGVQFISALQDKNESRRKLGFVPEPTFTFHYNYAIIYFGAGQFRSARKHFAKVINLQATNYRKELQFYARLLQMIVFYEMNEQDLFESGLRSLLRVAKKRKILSEFHKLFIEFLKTIQKQFADLNKKDFVAFEKKLLKLFESNPAEQRVAELHFDFLSWVGHKSGKGSFSNLVRQKAAAAKKRG